MKKNFLFKIILFIVIFVILIYIFYEKILFSYANYLEVNTAQKEANGIIILAGRPETRVKHAINLLKNNFSEKIFITDPAKRVKEFDFILSPREKTEKIFEYYDANISDIEVLKSTKNGATSTFDEAYDLVNYLKTEKILNKNLRFIIVTDSFHSRRAIYAFNKVLELHNLQNNIKIEVSPVQSKSYTKTNWWKHEYGLLDYIPEGFKLIIYFLTSKNLESIENK
jgi:uncharacterized SAM-binding protein YcdF (DUF218 family)